MTTSPQRDGLPARERRLALVSTAIGTFTASLDYGLVNLALPSISLAFGVPPGQAIWIVTTYQLGITSSLLLFAALGDSLGAKRVYLGALTATMLATAGCALSPVLAVLIGMRGLQGIACSANMVMTAPMNRMIYPRRMLGHAIANNSLFVATGNAAGPTIAGLILSVAPWQAIFSLNVPIIAVGIAVGLRYLPTARGTGRRVDLLSVLLSTIGLCTLVYGIQDFGHRDAPLRVLALVVFGAILTTAFVRRQLRLAHPLLAVDLLRRPLVALAVATAVTSYFSFGATFVTLPFYLQLVLHRTPLETGLLIASWPIATVAVTRVIGPLTGRYSPAVLCMIGLLITASGLALYAIGPHTTPGLIAAGALCGIGFGAFQTPNNYAIIGATPPGETGRATGIITTFRTTANALGAAVVAVLFNTFGITSLGLWVAAISCVLGAIISISRLGSGARSPAEPSFRKA